MGVMVYIVLLGWIPLTLALFATLPPRRAMLITYLAGVLFMPVGFIKFPGIPDYSRATAMSILTAFAVVVFDFGRLAKFRFRLIDVPMLMFCFVPSLSSLHNGLGVYDAISAGVHEFLVWGIPYFMGRLYINDLEGVRELAMGIAVACVVYIPFCLFESRFSPQLHIWIYGYHQHQFAQSYRWGGFRPVVFMEHGLAVALWMAIGTVILVWFWATGAVRRVLSMPIGLVVLAQVGTFLLCRSAGALILTTCALGALFAARTLRLRMPVVLLALVPALYIADRVTRTNAIKAAVDISAKVNQDRANSFGSRIDNEILLVEKALQEPLVGWAGWGRSRVQNEEGEDMAVTDGLWVITLGSEGVLGLAGLLGWQLLPPLLILRRIRPKAIGAAEAAAPLALAVSLLVVAMDALPNAPSSPIYSMISGGLASLGVALRPKALRVQQSSASEPPPSMLVIPNPGAPA
jgi:hypothetical protein